MSIWSVPAVEFEPDIILINWSVYEVITTEKRYFIGYSVNACEARVSSAITDFDSKACVGKTNSGRTYQLLGETRVCMNAEYVWATLIGRKGLTELDYDDVSDEYCGKKQ